MGTVEQNFILDGLNGLADQYEKVGGIYIRRGSKKE